MYKVLKNFTDKYTGVRYKAGDIVEFTEKRAKEILTVGNLIEKIEVVETVEEVEKPKKKSRKK